MTFLIVIVILILLTVLFGIKIIPESKTMVIERLGKYHKTLSSGFNFILPFFDKPKTVSTLVLGKNQNPTIGRSIFVDLREQVMDYPKQNVITKDNVTLEIDAVVYFQIMEPNKSIYEIVSYPVAIEKLTQTTLRNVIGELELDESLTSRDTINSKLQLILDEATDKWGIKVNRVEVQDIIPPEETRKQMEKQMSAEREKRASILISEGKKQSAILEAEGIRQFKINEAEGIRQSEILKAEGEAQAIELVKKALGSKDNYVQYIIANKYISAFEKLGEGKDSKMIYLPYESSGILSSLGGIGQLFEKNGLPIVK